MPGPTVFISYSHKDKDLLGPLVAQLKTLQQAGLLEVWDDSRIDVDQPERGCTRPTSVRGYRSLGTSEYGFDQRNGWGTPR